MPDLYIAHGYCENGMKNIQSISEHNFNVANLAMKQSPLAELSKLAWICGIYHDAGKYSDVFQNYIEKAIEGKKTFKGEVDHSSGGGHLIEKLYPKSKIAQFAQMAVFSHHGLNNCFRIGEPAIFLEERLKKDIFLDIEDRYYQWTDKNQIWEEGKKAQKDVENILKEINNFIQKYEEHQYGNKYFYLGMYERVLLSLLIDADRTDTAGYMHRKSFTERKNADALGKIWKRCIVNLEEYIKEFKVKTKLDEIRQQISEQCMKAGETSQPLYRLTVPTGGGKTLSSLRFALYHAYKFQKNHVIYVAPYQSIIEQNAEEIRRAVGNSEIVLEHHCNIVHENADIQKQYELLTENWSAPIIVTTAVQFFNTLFASGNGNIRRMYNTLNSVIIFDEVQALPVKITKLYNLAVNFLTTFGKSTIVLCSATQPPFEALDKDKMLPPVYMTDDLTEYKQVFKRTNLINATEEKLSIEDLQIFIQKKTQESKQILVIVNTKKCAENVFRNLKESDWTKEYELFHLSTNMCALNRQQVIKNMENGLKSGKKLICISTQLIEAGVNLSFQCVIRSMAGLDSIIQAAGRCNRHKEEDMGKVYIVQLSQNAECIDRIPEIRKSQESMRKVLEQFRIQPEKFPDGLMSFSAITLYYQMYLIGRKEEMEFPVLVEGVNTSILQLLSKNEKLWLGLPEDMRKAKGKLLMKQFFKTAGELFEVIPEDGKIDLIVEYDSNAKEQIELLDNPYITTEEKKQAIKKLQVYSVSISEVLRRKLGNVITTICNGNILILSENYYSKETGVSENPVGMEFLNF